MAERVEVVVAGRDKASGRHDVVLLDRDATVGDACFDKLRRCAAADARIGTVVPWSARTLVPQSTDVALVNAALDRASPRLYPDLDDAHAPCIYVKGRLLRDVGGADALSDRALLQSRARAAGYRNVLCDDAYAGTSAAGLASHGTPRTLAPVARLARTQVAIESRSGAPGILHVLHSRGGGTEKYVQSLVGASRAQFRHYFLRVAPDRWLFKDAIGEHGASCEWPRDAASEDCLRTMCAWLAIDLVHVHSLVGSGDDLARMIASTALPYCYSVHDMYAPCPTVYLIDASGRYCNATTDLAACAQCLSRMPSFADVDIAHWRARYASLLEGAAKVFAPSQWAGDTLRAYYPGANVEIRPHPVQADRAVRRDVSVLELPHDGCRHVAVLGAIGPEKGARIVDALADEIRKRSLPLRIVVVGFSDRARRWQSDDRTLTIHGSYGQDELPALFERYRVDLVVFPTIWPETFSYTLSEAWRAGRPALVPPRGALAERVEATGAGWLMRGWPDVAAIADELVALTSGARVAELSQRARLARDAADAEARAGTGVPYEGVARARARATLDAATLHGIYAAACRAMSLDAAPARAPQDMPARRSPLERLLRLVGRT
jgi:glycosyltransferase involved in cell wall biosynthesis